MIYGFVCQDLRLQIRQSRNVTDGHQGGQSGHVEEAGVVEAGVNESNRSGPYKITYHRLCARVKSTHLVKRANTPPTSNIQLNLMLTRKSIHHEVRLIFYHQTRFLFVSPQALNHFLNMGKEQFFLVANMHTLRDELPALRALDISLGVFDEMPKICMAPPLSNPFLGFSLFANLETLPFFEAYLQVHIAPDTPHRFYRYLQTMNPGLRDLYLEDGDYLQETPLAPLRNKMLDGIPVSSRDYHGVACEVLSLI